MSKTTDKAQSVPVSLKTGPGGRPFYPFVKRLFDIVFSLFGLVLFAPVALVISLAIKVTDRGPVFYRQERVGQGGRPFHILKFRTMVVDAERQGPAVTQEEDPRITRIGRILRRTKLDEMPQLWNVLKGEMSFVGPRPESPRYVAQYTEEQKKLLQFKPGITDLATLMFRDEETLLRNAEDVEKFYVEHCIPRKFNLNMQYARRASLTEDIYIILETLCPYTLGVFCGYALILALAFWFSYLLRYDFSVPVSEQAQMPAMGIVVVSLQMAFLMWRRQFVGLMSYFDAPEAKQMAYGLGTAAGVQFLVWYVSMGDLMPGRSIILIDTALAFLFLAGTRLSLRNMREKRNAAFKVAGNPARRLRLGIIGAGDLGTWLAGQLNHQGKGKGRVVAFFDDDPDKWNMRFVNVPVVGMPECILNGSWSEQLDEVILAVPAAEPRRKEEMVKILEKAGIKARTIATLEDILAR